MIELNESTDLLEFFGIQEDCVTWCPKISFYNYWLEYKEADSDFKRIALAGELARELLVVHGKDDPAACPTHLWDSDSRFDRTIVDDKVLETAFDENGECAKLLANRNAKTK
jgi:hypothetical protein